MCGPCGHGAEMAAELDVVAGGIGPTWPVPYLGFWIGANAPVLATKEMICALVVTFLSLMRKHS